MPDPSNCILIRHLAPRNFLSFGTDNPGIELQALNLLIGPNGSGKSNLFEAISLIRSAPKELREVTRKGGGVGEWIWKGGTKEPASVDCVVRDAKDSIPLRHLLSFRSVAQAFSLEDERVERARPQAGQPDVDFFYRYQHGQPVVNTSGHGKRGLTRESIAADRSIL
ncbi:MAG TPA: chromosome segregation protein SMC, partial [Candidatus Accumulibacter sp.]|nr:chromosome segregation protein SMC [Accumulibacter sp.]